MMVRVNIMEVSGIPSQYFYNYHWCDWEKYHMRKILKLTDIVESTSWLSMMHVSMGIK